MRRILRPTFLYFGAAAAVLLVWHADSARGFAPEAGAEPSPVFQRTLEKKLAEMSGELATPPNLPTLPEEGEVQQAFFPVSEFFSGCIASGCAASGCLSSGCGGSGCIGSACGGSGCGGSICGGSVCSGSACLGSACLGSNCVGSGCTGSLCVGSGCVGSNCVGSACTNCSAATPEEPKHQPGEAGAAPAVGGTSAAYCPLGGAGGSSPLRITGLNISHVSDGVEIAWSVSDAEAVSYQLFRLPAAPGVAPVLLTTGEARSDRLMRVVDRGEPVEAGYLLRVVDLTGAPLDVQVALNPLR
jgi:hypothetical protein